MLLEPAASGFIGIQVTEHNDNPEGGTIEQAELYGNLLVIQVIQDRDEMPEEPDELYRYILTDEQRDRLANVRNYEDRGISVEWVYTKIDHDNEPPSFITVAEYEALPEERDEEYLSQEDYALGMDISI
jgi:hypothetical protein